MTGADPKRMMASPALLTLRFAARTSLTSLRSLLSPSLLLSLLSCSVRISRKYVSLRDAFIAYQRGADPLRERVVAPAGLQPGPRGGPADGGYSGGYGGYAAAVSLAAAAAPRVPAATWGAAAPPPSLLVAHEEPVVTMRALRDGLARCVAA